MYERTPTAIMVTPLDFSSLNKSAFDALAKDDRYKEATECYSLKHGIVKTKRGLFVLDSEGVGPSEPITSDNPLAVDFWAKTQGGGGWVMPVVSGKLDDQDLLKLVTDQQINLSDWIENRGSRRNSNYESWRRHLEAIGG